MKLTKFKFELPPDLIALNPTDNRDESRMMVVHRDTGKIEHKIFKDLVDYFDEKDVFINNDTKVFSARLYGNKEKTGAKIEVCLLRELNEKNKLWDVLVDPARKIRVGNKLFFGDGRLVAEVIDNTTSRGRTIRFLFEGDSDLFYRVIDEIGETSLPREIKRNVEEHDKERFQTIYAKNIGSVVAPTAGLHFTPQLLKRFELNGVDFASITLHVSLGAYEKIEVEDLSKFKMSSESFEVLQSTAKIINDTKKAKSKVCAVGVSVLKAIESSITVDGSVKENSGWTDKFIYPPYDFSACDALITNLHTPQTSLQMTAYAFGGYDLMVEAYKVAIKEKYRFMSYGDAMLIL